MSHDLGSIIIFRLLYSIVLHCVALIVLHSIHFLVMHHSLKTLLHVPATIRTTINYLIGKRIGLFIQFFIMTDIDECSKGISGCAQDCKNTIGSYTCSCKSGYRLGKDLKSCIGKLKTKL